MEKPRATRLRSPFANYRRLSRSLHFWGYVAPMRCAAAALLCGLLATAAQDQTKKQETPASRPPSPYWAFAVNPPAAADDHAPKKDADVPQHLPGSSATVTLAQLSDLFAAPDWHSDGHPPMPETVARGRKPGLFACGYCHLPNGQGRPENSSLAGLPADYIVEQIADFKNGLRKNRYPKLLPVAAMTALAATTSDAEVESAAKYFASLKPVPWIRVVETKRVPKTHVEGWMLVASNPAGTEPIGRRIIETPVDLEQTELRNDRSGFIAYVPIGSIKEGEALVTSGGAGRTLPCASCHGPQLTGLGNVPSIAGRSPSYIVRQLYNIQRGDRSGAAVRVMQPVVAKLTSNDILSIAAYTSSLHP
jgi:cytochrome c553